MSTCPYRTITARAPNAVNANPQRLESPDGRRWATGRNVKKALPERRWEPVQVWALKERGADGKAVTVRAGTSHEDALEWVR